MTKQHANQPDWEGFTRAIMKDWMGGWGDMDGGVLQDAAIDHGILAPAPEGFDPELHDDPYHNADPGDPWLVPNYEVEPDEQ